MRVASPATVPKRSEAHFDGLVSSFDAAADATGVIRDRYSIAGAPVSLHFASPALRERLTRAFSHLGERATERSGASELSVFLWDSASTGAEPPSRPQVPADHADGALYYIDRPPLRAAYQPGLETLSVLDSEAGVAWHWVADAFEQPSWDQASPVRQILFWWLGSRGRTQVHGAAVGTSAGGALLVGKGGSGKSTAALASLGSELLYAGDDYVAVSLEPTPWVHSLYNSGKLDLSTIRELLPHLLPLASNPETLDREKAVFYVQEQFPDQTTSGFPLRAILVPTVHADRREHRITEASRAAAFAALAPSTILQLHTAGSDVFAMMSRLIQQVPCYGIELGSDIASIPETIAEFLARLPSD